ncbi:PKD domain protein [compost metagenome]
MKKFMQLAVLLFLSTIGQLNAQNISTGIDDAGGALTAGATDPNWRIIASPIGAVDAKNTPNIPGTWESTPVAGSNAGWINAAGTPCSGINKPGNYTFERSFTISSSVASFIASLQVAYDDNLISLALIDPAGTNIPLTVTPTSPYMLSMPVTYSNGAPMAGTWRIRAVVEILSDQALCGGFLLSGEITTSCDPLPCTCDLLNPSFSVLVDKCHGTFTSTTDIPPCMKEHGAEIYEWTVAGVYAGSSSTLNYTFPSNGGYAVCLKITTILPDGKKCTKEICQEVAVTNCNGCGCDDLQPIINYNVDKCSSILNGSSILPSCMSGASVSYNWLVNGTYVGSGTPFIYPFPGNGIYNLCLNATVILADGTKCTQDTCVEVIVNNCDECKCNQMQPAFTYTVNNCIGSFTNTTVSPDCIQRTIKWFVDSVLVGTGNTFNYTFPGSGTYTVCMKVAGVLPGGVPCKKYICKEITVDCGPCNCYDLNPNFSIAMDKCNGTFISTSQVPSCLGNVTYEWSVDGAPAGTGTTLNYTFSTFGGHNVCLKITGIMPDGTSCVRETCYTVSPNELCPDPCNCNNIQPVFSINNLICNATFDGSASSAPACLQNLTYKWYVGVTGSGILSPVGTGTTLSFSFPGSGTYTVCLMISGYLPDGTYCEKMECKDVTAVCVTFEPGGPIHHRTFDGNSINLYPNPASDALTIEMTLKEAAEVQIIMRSADGKELVTEKRKGEAGSQRFQLQIPESVSNSMVFVEIITGNETFTRMVTISK